MDSEPPKESPPDDSVATHSGDSSDTDWVDQGDFQRISVDTETWADLHYVAETWEDTSGALGVDGLPADFL